MYWKFAARLIVERLRVVANLYPDQYIYISLPRSSNMFAISDIDVSDIAAGTYHLSSERRLLVLS